MDFKFDPPVQENTPQFSAWVARQFERVRDALGNHQDERKGIYAVTGSVTIPTGLKRVQYCFASLASPPSPVAMLVTANLSATAGSIDLKVYRWGGTWNDAAGVSSSFPLSTVPINVAWFAYGF